MYVLNKAARLITFSWEGKKYKLMPAGDSVELPDTARKSKFLSALAADGSVVIESTAAQADLMDDIDDLAELRQEAADLSIKVDKRWGESKLQEMIDAKLAEDTQE